MGRIKGREAIKDYMKKYGSMGVDYFSLKDDGDSAKVRFLHTDDTDLELMLVHRVEVDGKERWIECLEEGCPFCEDATIGRPTLKLFILMLDRADDKVKCWERGSTMIDFLLGYIDKCGHLNNRDYEIVRHGKKGSTKTQYQLFPGEKDKDGEEVELPERPKVYGKFVLQWDEQQMTEYLEDTKPVPRERAKSGKGPGF